MNYDILLGELESNNFSFDQSVLLKAIRQIASFGSDLQPISLGVPQRFIFGLVMCRVE